MSIEEEYAIFGEAALLPQQLQVELKTWALDVNSRLRKLERLQDDLASRMDRHVVKLAGTAGSLQDLKRKEDGLEGTVHALLRGEMVVQGLDGVRAMQEDDKPWRHPTQQDNTSHARDILPRHFLKVLCDWCNAVIHVDGREDKDAVTTARRNTYYDPERRRMCYKCPSCRNEQGDE